MDASRGIVDGDDPGPFGALLRGYRRRAGRSRRSLCREIGCNAAYSRQLERGERRRPGRHFVEAFARGLHLSAFEHNRLLVAAGYAPAIGEWDEALGAVCDVLTDWRLTAYQQARFRSLIRSLAAGWRALPPDTK